MAVKSVLLLAKPYPLSFGLERAIRDTGNRFLAVYERPRGASRVIKSILHRDGWLKTADILAYFLYERTFRGGNWSSDGKVSTIGWRVPACR